MGGQLHLEGVSKETSMEVTGNLIEMAIEGHFDVIFYDSKPVPKIFRSHIL